MILRYKLHSKVSRLGKAGHVSHHSAAFCSSIAALDKAGHDHKDAIPFACHAALSFQVAAARSEVCRSEWAPDAVVLAIPDQIATGQQSLKNRVWQPLEEGQAPQHLQADCLFIATVSRHHAR